MVWEEEEEVEEEGEEVKERRIQDFAEPAPPITPDTLLRRYHPHLRCHHRCHKKDHGHQVPLSSSTSTEIAALLVVCIFLSNG